MINTANFDRTFHCTKSSYAGLKVGLCEGLDVGLRVIGFDVGLREVGFDVGLRVGLEVGFDVALGRHRGALVPVPASFELSGHTINNQNSAVGLSCPCNHISDKVSVTWRVQNGKVTILSAEEPCGHLNRDTSLSLLICLVHNIRKFETWLAIFLSQLLILPHLLLVHMTKLIK